MQVIQVIILTMGLLLSFIIQAQDVKQDNVNSFDVEGIQVDNGFLEAWGIDKTEYRRFMYLKDNTPRGIYTPSANPLYYLGMEARTDAERKKYAKLIAKMEFENVQKMQMLNREILLASKQIFGSGQAVDLSIGESLKKEMDPLSSLLGNKQQNPSLATGRDLFVSLDCDDCIKKFKGLMGQLSVGTINTIDIVFPATVEDIDIKRWAYKAGVSPELNDRKVIGLRRAGENEKVDTYPSVRISAL